MSYDIDCTVKTMACDVDLVEECTVKAVFYDVWLTSDYLVDLEQCGSFWNHVVGL